MASSDGYTRWSATENQRALWALHLAQPDSDTYNLWFALRIDGHLDEAVLRESLFELCRRHRILAAPFRADDRDALVQEFDAHSVCLRVSNIAGLDIARITEHLSAAAHAPFALSSGEPPFRTTLFRGVSEDFLLVCAHHIVADLESMYALFRELGHCYHGVRYGIPPAAHGSAPYAAFAAWQTGFLRSVDAERDLSYWREAFPAGPRRVGGGLDDRPTWNAFQFDQELAETVRGLIERLRARDGLRVTGYSFWLAALGATLARRSGVAEVVIATAMRARPNVSYSHTIGYFSNLVPITLQVPVRSSPRRLLESTVHSVLEAKDHQHLPFPRIVREAQASVSRLSDLAPVSMQMESGEPATLMAAAYGFGDHTFDFAGMRCTVLPLGVQVGEFDLTVRLVATSSLDGGVHHRSSALTAPQATDLLTELQDAARMLVDDVARDKVVAFRGARASDVAELVALGAGGPLDMSLAADPLVQMLTVDRTRVAIEEDGKTFSYGDLLARASGVATMLKDIPTESCVGVVGSRVSDMVVGMVGVMLAGAVYVPLDQAMAPTRLSAIALDCQLRVIVGDAAALARMPAISDHKPIDGLYAPHVASAPSRRSSQLAYVLYTSGSTGMPKGVAVTVSNLAASTHARGAVYGGSDVRFLMLSPMWVDSSLAGVIWTLSVGGTLICHDPREQAQSAFSALLADTGATHVLAVPSLLRELFRDAESRAACRVAISAGERCPAAVAELVCRRPGLAFYNEYGPSEATIWSTYWSTSSIAGCDGDVPIGRAIPGARVYVMADTGVLAAPGAAGELWVGGDGVARGYIGQPALTAERFVPDPFGPPGSRAYRTGDRVRMQADGVIEFLGRYDDQVKIRGFRVEPGEVEAAGLSCPGVEQLVVVAVEMGEDDRRLVAYYVSPHEAGIIDQRLRAHFADRLPAYMVPTMYQRVDRLPVSPSGKVDRRALPRPTEPSVLVRPPRTREEALLARIWADVLGRDQVGIDQGFVALGGDSILSIQVCSRAKAAGWTISPRQVLEADTIERLARRLSQRPTPAIGTGDVRHIGYTASPAQQWFWSLSTLRPQHWNMSARIDFDGSIAIQDLSRAIRALVERHDALRTTWTPADGAWAPHAVSNAWQPRQLAIIDAGQDGFDTTDHLARIETWQQSVDLTVSPLGGFVLVRNGWKGGDTLLLIVHHLAVDAVSWQILIAQLDAAYRSPGQVVRPRNETSFSAWTAALRRYGSGRAVSEAPYWTSVVARPDGLTSRLGLLSAREGDMLKTRASLSRTETDRLLMRPHRLHLASVEELLLCAAARALRRATGVDGALYAMEGHGREPEAVQPGTDVTETVGWLTSLFPLHIQLSRRGTPSLDLSAVQRALRSVPNRGVGYGALLRFGPSDVQDALTSRSGALVNFNFLGRVDTSESAERRFHFREFLPAQRCSDGAAPFPLVLEAAIVNGELHLLTSVPRGGVPFTSEELASLLVGELAQIVEGSMAGRMAELAEEWGDVEAVRPATGVQAGMLYHMLAEPGSEVYVEQLAWQIDGDLNEDAFLDAWRLVVRRHAALRTCFVWEGVDEPLQVVRRGAQPHFQVLDWSDGHTEDTLDAFLAMDRAAGIDLEMAPLLRVTLVRVGVRRWYCIWTHSHLIIDGWCLLPILQELAIAHDAFGRGEDPELPPAEDYGRYLDWLAARSPDDDAHYWRDQLSGANPSRLVAAERQAQPGAQREYTVTLSEDETDAILRFCRRQGLTLSTLAHAAWGRVLSDHTASSEAIFGSVTAGRSPDVHGAENMVGLFINTIPVRIRQPRGEGLAWLRSMQQQLLEAQDHQHLPLHKTLAAAGPRGRSLFDTLLVVANYPLPSTQQVGEALIFSPLRVVEKTNYPLTVTVTMGAGLVCAVNYRAREISDAIAEELTSAFLGVLCELARDAGLEGTPIHA